MPFPRPIRAVVFDMDGLLLDTEKPVRAASLAAAARLGRPMDEATYALLIGRTFPTVRSLLLEHFGGEAELEAFWTAFRGILADVSTGGIALMPGVVELIDHLEARGLPLAVCTSTGRERALHHLAKAGISHRFRHVVGGDDVERGKPHPDPYLKAAGLLGQEPAHCLALEDSHNGIRAAHAAGMMAVMVPDLLPATDEMRGLCLHIADDLHAVRALISRIDEAA